VTQNDLSVTGLGLQVANGWSELSSRRPISLVRRKTKQNATTARTTMSI
jgi:hypothetical protein